MVRFRRLERANLQIPAVTRLAVVDFDDPTRRGVGPAVGNVLVSQLASQGYYQIMERGKIQSVMKEHAFNLTGAVDPATIRELGGLLGVDAIITGEIVSYNVETNLRTEMVEKKVGTGQYQEVEKKKPFSDKTYKVKEEIMKTVLVPEERTSKSGTVSINYRMVDIASGKVAVSKTHSASSQRSYKDNIPGDDQILGQLLTKVTDSFVSDISPHYIAVAKRVLKPKSDPGETGAAYARQGEWRRATEIWQRFAAANPKDAALWHNLGVASEAMGQIEEAEQNYNRALALEPQNRLYIENIAQLRNAFRGSLPSENQQTAAAGNSQDPATASAGKIIRLESTGEIYVDIGAKAGLKPGDRLMAYGEKEIRNPDTGEILDVEAFEKAELLVVKVMINSTLCRSHKSLSASKLAIKDKVRIIKVDK
jgi:curli biogenesis system outer membrane secretion channel CsgG